MKKITALTISLIVAIWAGSVIFASYPIREPATMLLLGAGLFGFTTTRLRRNNK